MDVKNFRIVVLYLILFSIALFAQAQDAVPAPEKAEAAKTAGKQPALTEDQKSQMALLQDYSTVNEHHKFLENLTGTWNAKVEFWMEPDAQPEVSEGISEAELIMGGRFVEQTYNGTMMGQPFEGREILGYDNLKKEYTGIWIDNMSTGIMLASGQYNPESKIMAAEGSMSCPMTQETNRWYRGVTTFIDADNYTYETYMKDQKGVEYRSMVITYSRSK